MNTRTILLIGKTGNGKSTLANVLSGTGLFTESSGSTSETRDLNIQLVEIKLNEDGSQKVNYRIIDTVGVGDTRLTPQGVLYKLAKIAHSLDNGLNQILFVVGQRFTKEEVEAYNLLKQIIFDSEVNKFTTIVRTNFPEFYDEDQCQNDRQALGGESSQLAGIVSSVNKIIYVNNPPLKGLPSSVAAAKESREISRQRLLLHLETCVNIYRPGNLATLNDRIKDYLTEEEKLQKEIKEKEEQIRQQEAKMQQELNNLRTQQSQQLASLQASFQEQMRQANEQRAKEIRDLEEKNKREVGQIREDNDRRLKQMQDDGRRQQEETNRLMRDLEAKKNNSSDISSQLALLAPYLRSSDNDRSKNEDSVAKLNELNTRLSNSENSHKETMGELNKNISDLNKKLENTKKDSESKVAQAVATHVEEKVQSQPNSSSSSSEAGRFASVVGTATTIGTAVAGPAGGAVAAIGTSIIYGIARAFGGN